MILNFIPLLQNDFGGPNDCTLTSITAIVNYYTYNIFSIKAIYQVVEDVAKKYFYTLEGGTYPWFNKVILTKSLKKTYSACSRKFKSRYFKGIGWNLKLVDKILSEEKPIMLSLFRDGVGKYDNHTVTIVGVDAEDKKLVIQDNWTLEPQILDYNKLSIISCIVY